jgi:hypothetical protein
MSKPLLICCTTLAGVLLWTPGLAEAQQRFLIEREIPGAAQMSAEQLREAAQKSNRVLRDLGPEIQWVQSYVAGDKLYCIYNAPNETLIRTHAERSGFPANRITPVAAVIDPTTARASH